MGIKKVGQYVVKLNNCYTNAVLASQHVPLLAPGGTVSCLLCLQGHDGTYAQRRSWLCTRCPMAGQSIMRTAGPQPAPVTKGRQIYVAGMKVHSSHTLFVFKQLYFCNLCGYVAGHRVGKLKDACPRAPHGAGR